MSALCHSSIYTDRSSPKETLMTRHLAEAFAALMVVYSLSGQESVGKAPPGALDFRAKGSVKAVERAIAELRRLQDDDSSNETELPRETPLGVLERHLWYLRTRAYPNDRIDEAAVRRAAAAVARQATVSGGGRYPAWTRIGPVNLTPPVNDGRQLKPDYGPGFVAGRVNAVAFDPSN